MLAEWKVIKAFGTTSVQPVFVTVVTHGSFLEVIKRDDTCAIVHQNGNGKSVSPLVKNEKEKKNDNRAK